MGLVRLSVKNYVLVENLEIEFHPGFNVITGETGAGKSLIIGTLNIALGEKIDWDLMGDKEAEITAVFKISEREKQILKENNIEVEDDEIIVRRVLNPQGKKSKIYINMTPVTLNFLKEITDKLVDLHGQHQHQSLLNPSSHIDFLDSFCKLNNLRRAMESVYNSLIITKSELENLIKRQREVQEKAEFYQFKLEELEKANLREGEEQELEERINILSNLEKLQNLINSSIFELYESEDSAYEKTFKVIKNLQELTSIDPKLSEPLNILNELSDKIADTWRFLVEYRNNLSLNPEELDELRNRLAFLRNLKQKYRKTIEELIEEKNCLKNELERIENFDIEIESLQKKIENLRKEAESLAQKLHNARVEASPKLEKLIEDELKDLAMEKAKFVIQIQEREELSPLGKDKVEFFISTNPGEQPRPLYKIISGGELSRIMLAIKRVLSEFDNIPTLVFDEADTGIGGKVAEKVGRKMREISKNRQVITITHLPQAAVFGDKHLLVEKHLEHNKTRINIRELGEEERIKELARMLSGEKITEESISYAEKFLQSVRGEK